MIATSNRGVPKVEGTPSWMNEEAYRVLETSLLPGETPRDGYWRVATAAADRLGRPELAERFFKLVWNNWLCLATPVIANMGTDRGLPISCFGISVPDTTSGIFLKAHEQAMMSKNGGGVGIYLGDVRHRGAPISTGTVSEGICSWARLYHVTIDTVSQGGVRRGASVVTLPIDHPDFEEFLNLREIESSDEFIREAKQRLMSAVSSNRMTVEEAIEAASKLNTAKTFQLNHAVSITDDFMMRVQRGDPTAVSKFKRVIQTRVQTGEPYILFIDNMNRQRGECYERLGLYITQSNLCVEIGLYSDPEHSFVCCLSSMNAARWEEWSMDDRAVRDSIWFLDAVMGEFIARAKDKTGMECAVRFSEKSRALGLGVLGLHSLYQKNRTHVESFLARNLNRAVFKHIHDESQAATRELAAAYGEPEWCKGTGRRNTHLTAVAPTLANSIAAGQWSPGIEPYPGNRFSKKTKQGMISCRNPVLQEILELSKNNTEGVWESILEHRGSVQQLPFLSEQDKLAFRTFREIPQHELINQAADRQVYIEQAQSLNLAFASNADPTYIAKCHVTAWQQGIKSLYYCKSEASSQATSGALKEAERKFLTAAKEPEVKENCEFCG